MVATWLAKEGALMTISCVRPTMPLGVATKPGAAEAVDVPERATPMGSANAATAARILERVSIYLLPLGLRQGTS